MQLYSCRLVVPLHCLLYCSFDLRGHLRWSSPPCYRSCLFVDLQKLRNSYSTTLQVPLGELLSDRGCFVLLAVKVEDSLLLILGIYHTFSVTLRSTFFLLLSSFDLRSHLVLLDHKYDKKRVCLFRTTSRFFSGVVQRSFCINET